MADSGKKAGAAVVVVAAVSGGLHSTGSFSRLAELASTGGETVASSASVLGAGLQGSGGLGRMSTGVGEAVTFDRAVAGSITSSGHIVSGEEALATPWNTMDQMTGLAPIRMPMSSVVSMPTGSPAASVTAQVTNDAQADIIARLEPHRNALTSDDATAIIKEQLAKSSEAIGKRDSAIDFVVLTGKLDIKPEFHIAGVKLSFGEVNVYKLAAIAGGTVMACNGLGVTEFKACVAAALKAASKAVLAAKAEGIEPGK